MIKMVNGKFIIKALSIICGLQIVVTFYIVTKIYTSEIIRPDRFDPHHRLDEAYFGDEEQEDINFNLAIDEISHDVLVIRGSDTPTIEIWGKSHIASYLWEHILEGRKELNEYMSVYHGEIQLDIAVLKYREGPGLTPKTAESDVSNLVLVLHGRELKNVVQSKKWLDTISEWPNVKVILLVLGNEKCENEWILQYMHPKGPVHGVFLTYDDPIINNRTFVQWPLGVASYRHFPLLTEEQIEASKGREFSCNLQATNYENSSRIELFRWLSESAYAKQNCKVVDRKRWIPTETTDSINDYIRVIVDSDLTLCPAGFNTETYRVFEALSAGSIPVIEDQPSGGHCASRGWRILKEHNAPVIWIKSWKELDFIFEKEKRLSSALKISRRWNIIHWYKLFREKMKNVFLSFIIDKFHLN